MRPDAAPPRAVPLLVGLALHANKRRFNHFDFANQLGMSLSQLPSAHRSSTSNIQRIIFSPPCRVHCCRWLFGCPTCCYLSAFGIHSSDRDGGEPAASAGPRLEWVYFKSSIGRSRRYLQAMQVPLGSARRSTWPRLHGRSAVNRFKPAARAAAACSLIDGMVVLLCVSAG